MTKLLMGPLALVIRYILYTIGGALIGVGVAAQTIDGSQLCLDMKGTSEFMANAIVLILSGGAVTGATILWSRLVAMVGGKT